MVKRLVWTDGCCSRRDRRAGRGSGWRPTVARRNEIARAPIRGPGPSRLLRPPRPDFHTHRAKQADRRLVVRHRLGARSPSMVQSGEADVATRFQRSHRERLRERQGLPVGTLGLVPVRGGSASRDVPESPEGIALVGLFPTCSGQVHRAPGRGARVVVPARRQESPLSHDVKRAGYPPCGVPPRGGSPRPRVGRTAVGIAQRGGVGIRPAADVPGPNRWSASSRRATAVSRLPLIRWRIPSRTSRRRD